MVLQLAPSVNHQASAMLSILMRYNWHNFAIITSAISGHDDFVQAIRDRALELEKEASFKFIVLTTVMVLGETEKDLGSLVGSESRILLLYCSKEEARNILQTANKLGLTGSNYVWIVTQSVIGDSLAPNEFPVGMLGKFLFSLSL
jgi:ionotropic glutamate receptor NMDA 2B